MSTLFNRLFRAAIAASALAFVATSGGEALAAVKAKTSAAPAPKIASHPWKRNSQGQWVPTVGRHAPGIGKHQRVDRKGKMVKPGGHPNKGGGRVVKKNLPEGLKPSARWTACQRNNYWRVENGSRIVRCPNMTLSNSAPYSP
jgi:hypothetical protein